MGHSKPEKLLSTYAPPIASRASALEPFRLMVSTDEQGLFWVADRAGQRFEAGHDERLLVMPLPWRVARPAGRARTREMARGFAKRTASHPTDAHSIFED